MNHHSLIAWPIVVLICLSTSTAFAQTFSDQTALLGATNNYSGVAMGVVDMNGDGLDDVVRLNGASDLLIEYQNAPNTAFSNYTFGNLGSSLEWSLCVGDCDNNGYNDLIAGGAYNEIKLLTANATGTGYTSSNLPGGTIFLQGSNFVDISGDGWLDIFACHDDDDSHSFRNNGSGTFVLDHSLIDTLMASGNSGNYASIWTDYDNDGDLDMYLSKCRQGVSNPADPRRINRLFQNDGTNAFSEVAASAGLHLGDQTWCTDFADIDNDGDMDCFVLNHDSSSLLMENNGDGTFSDITSTSGMSASDLDLYGIQCLFRDFDNDGFVDLLLAGTEHRLFHNNGNKTFARLSNPFGANDMESFAVGDLNADGYLDIYAGYANLFNSPSNTPDALFMNDGGTNNFFGVRLQGVTSNANGIGARVELHGSWGLQVREVRSGEGYGIMNSLTQHFGIGTATIIDRLVVKWPSGTVDALLLPSVNQVVTLVEGSTLPLNVAPAAYSIVRGTYVSGGLAELELSDNADLVIRRSLADIQSRAEFIVDAVSPLEEPNSLQFTLEAAVFARSTVIQKIYLYNYGTTSFDELDTRNASRFSDQVVTVPATGDLSQYVEPGTGAMSAKIEFMSPVQRQNFSCNVDQTMWTIE